MARTKMSKLIKPKNESDPLLLPKLEDFLKAIKSSYLKRANTTNVLNTKI